MKDNTPTADPADHHGWWLRDKEDKYKTYNHNHSWIRTLSSMAWICRITRD
jgi:hypothetical protein